MRIFNCLLNLFFPPRCAFCRAILRPDEQMGHICKTCLDTLPICQPGSVLQEGESYIACISPLYFVENTRDSLHRFKFSARREYSKAYAPILAACIIEQYDGLYDIFSWVPVSDKRRRERGYDQAMLLALETARCLSQQAIQTLQKVKDTKPQSSIGAMNVRFENVKSAYAAIDPEYIAEKRVLLIDDVVTTGATLSAAAQALLDAGAKQVFCATLAQTKKKTVQ